MELSYELQAAWSRAANLKDALDRPWFCLTVGAPMPRVSANFILLQCCEKRNPTDYLDLHAYSQEAIDLLYDVKCVPIPYPDTLPVQYHVKNMMFYVGQCRKCGKVYWAQKTMEGMKD